MNISKFIKLKINKIRVKHFPKDFELSEDNLIIKAKKKLHLIRSYEHLAHSRIGYENGLRENMECNHWLNSVIAMEPGTRKEQLLKVMEELHRLKSLMFRVS
jgi:hypothetical protein